MNVQDIAIRVLKEGEKPLHAKEIAERIIEAGLCGAFDLQSELVLVPRQYNFSSELGNGRKGMSWKNKYGFVAINAVKRPFVTDGMNEVGHI